MDIIKRSFTSGELAPSLRVRADLANYGSGLALCENFFVKPQGGVYSRAGFSYRETIGQISKRARLIPFQFNTDQSYILLFEDLTMRVIKDGNYIESGGSPYEIATPYTEAQLPRLQFVQDADVMTLVHPMHDPRDLSRLADDNWSLDVIDFTPPILPPSFAVSLSRTITNITNEVTPLVTTSVAHGFSDNASITLSGLGGFFNALNGNSYQIVTKSTTSFYLVGVDSTGFGAFSGSGTAETNGLTAFGLGPGTFDKLYSYKVTAVDADGVESVASTSESITSKTLTQTWGIRIVWEAVAGANYYRVYKDSSNGDGIYGWIGDSESLTFDDFNVAPDLSDTPPEARNPLTGANNRPSTVAYYQQRRVFANSNLEPQTVYTTQTGVYNSLRTSFPAADDDAITFTIKGRQVNEIRHIISVDSMILLTSGAEWRLTEGQDQVLTPSAVGAKTQSYNGSSWVQPVLIDTEALYVQEKGTKIRNISYQFVDDKYNGSDLSILAEHLFDGYQIEEMTYSLEPYGIVWATRDDGVLLGLTYQKEQQVTAWHQHTTQGAFESVATISEEGRDALYVIVKRNINGSDTRYVERLEKRDTSSPENVYTVDCGLVYEGSLITILTNLQHLANEPVTVVADGVEVTGITVSAGGVITVPRAAERILVGLPYTPTIETLQVDSPSEAIRAKHKSIPRVTIEVEKSRGGWVAPINDKDNSTGPFVEIKPRFDSDGYGPIALKTFKEEVTISPQYNKGGAVRIEQRSPFPLGILAIIPTIDIS